MGKIISIAKVTFKEGIRERVFLGVLIFVGLLLIGSGFLADLSIGDILKVTQDIGLSGLSLLGLFVALFLSTHLIAKDLDKKTIYLVVSKPIARWQYILGKFLGLSFLTIFAIFVGFIVFLITLFYFWKTAKIYHVPQIAWGKHLLAFVYLNLKMCLLIAVGIFFSSFTSSALVAFSFSLLIYFIGANLQNVKMILESKVGENITPILKSLFKLAYWLFPNLSLLDLKAIAVHNLPLNIGNLGLSLLYGLAYTASLLLFASFIFDRRELN